MERIIRLLAAAALLAAGSCSPVYEGPQLSEVPEGLAYLTTIRSARHPLPDRELLGQYAYAVPGGMDWRTHATLSEYRGACDRAEVEAARDAFDERYGGRSSLYGPVEPFVAGGRPAWAYTADGLSDGKVERRGLVVVVPWDDRTYGIEVSSSEPAFIEREVQRRIAASFHVAKRGRYRGPLLALLAVAAAAGALVARRRRR